MPQSPSPLRLALESLPERAGEPIVSTIFAFPKLTEALGFSSEEVIPAYKTGTVITDFALRKNLSNSDIFLQTKTNPFLLIELKGRHINLKEGSPGYVATVKQLKKQLLDEKAKSCQWGLIANADNIQLFRKHGKAIFPATLNIQTTPENIDEVVRQIRKKIENPSRALTVTIYNNRGGIGKTTTTLNLATTLSALGKKVLVIDLDFNQRDLTRTLGVDFPKGLNQEVLASRDSLKPVVQTCEYKRSKISICIDALPTEDRLADFNEDKLGEKIPDRMFLHGQLEFARSEYDYIFIDASPGWRILTQCAMAASDVVLMPTRHNDINSLENAATAITRFLGKIQAIKGDGTPEALPIFFNGGRPTDPEQKRAHNAIARIIKTAKDQYSFNLLPYFFPRFTQANKDTHIYHVPNYATIAAASFDNMPAVLQSRPVFIYYKGLAEEYFLQ
ncbi:MAG: Sporulation initiation inhibitor protein Soj [Syntrophomonadaceae bacterium]|nr:Sporulation initiation inhibitor protein Soj [Bacillota bacterium]